MRWKRFPNDILDNGEDYFQQELGKATVGSFASNIQDCDKYVYVPSAIFGELDRNPKSVIHQQLCFGLSIGKDYRNKHGIEIKDTEKFKEIFYKYEAI